MAIYKTYFKLIYPVNDFQASEDCLTEDDMTFYLKRSFALSGDSNSVDIDKITSIEWHLKDEQSGEVVLTTTSELSQKDLDKISEWVHNTTRDSLSETFSHKQFAVVRECDKCDGGILYTDFDWKTNEYKFELISND